MKATKVPWLLSNVHNPMTGNLLADALPYVIHSVQTTDGK